MITTTIDQAPTKDTRASDDRWTVFLVDDNLDDLALGERVLRNSADIDEVVCLSSGAMLFDELRARHYFYDTEEPPKSLILLDLHMPKEDGLLLLTQLRTSPFTENIPVVMLTGDCKTDNIEKTYHMQANGYLSKPLRQEHLNHLHNILKRGQDWNDIERLEALFRRS